MKVVSGPIYDILTEHDRVGDLLKEIRGLTKGYEVPNDGCQSFHSFLKGIEVS
jgi:iron-sulfur cluster repair protein YtfE (RIC family)